MPKITIVIPDSCPPEQVRLILLDALAEFQSARGPSAEAYVNRRYPDTPEYAWLNRETKIAEVDERKRLAAELHRQIAVSEWACIYCSVNPAKPGSDYCSDPCAIAASEDK